MHETPIGGHQPRASRLARIVARPRGETALVPEDMTCILVADDAQSVRKLLRLILGPSYEVIEAGDGDQALRLLTDHQPEIAILDVSMPALTGIEVCERMRQDPHLAATGVIVITANGTPRDRAVALEAGADAFFAKPFSPTAVLKTVERVLLDRAAIASDG